MNILGTIGLTASLVGAAANVVNNYVTDKKMEQLIEEKVEEAFAKREEEKKV